MKKNGLYIVLLFAVSIVFCLKPSLNQNKINNIYSDNLKNTDTLKCDLNQCRTKTDIWNTIDSTTYLLKKYYDNYFKTKLKPEGKVTTKYVINPNGDVTQIETVDSEINDSLFIEGVKDILSKTKYIPINKHEDDTVVFPFIFYWKNKEYEQRILEMQNKFK